MVVAFTAFILAKQLLYIRVIYVRKKVANFFLMTHRSDRTTPIRITTIFTCVTFHYDTRFDFWTQCIINNFIFFHTL